MEEFGIAYIQAVASVAGCYVSRPPVDDDSIDLMLSARSTFGPVLSPKLDVQLKTTYQDVLRAEEIAYPLTIKNYDDLRNDSYAVPRILIVVLVPDEIAEWLAQDEECLAMRRCAYWATLRGYPEVSNEATRTVDVPRANVFNASTLQSIFARLRLGQLP